MEIRNAKIEGTMLGYEDHDLLTFDITLDYGGTAQCFGGYVLGKEYTTVVIEGLLKAVGVRTWEELKGNPKLCKEISKAIRDALKKDI